MKNTNTAAIARMAIGMSLALAGWFATAAFADSHGIVGEKIADFSASITSVTYEKHRTIVNMESDGTIGEFGTVQATATLMHPTSTNPPTGVYNLRGASFRADGSVVPFSGRGTWKSLGDLRWRLRSIGLAADGVQSMSVGILELKSRSMKGSVYALD